MKKKKVLFVSIIFFVLLFVTLAGSYLIYTRHICPVWDIQNKVCCNCNVSDTVVIDITTNNHCSNRKIVCDSDDIYKSAPMDYVVPNREGVLGTCGGPAYQQNKVYRHKRITVISSLIILCIFLFCIRKLR